MEVFIRKGNKRITGGRGWEGLGRKRGAGREKRGAVSGMGSDRYAIQRVR